ncbi:hypothetical protein KFE25_008184 [Diacronema lutheri]|uniref:AI-2E family transporter n=1 Tax=Diacronema lutheri TaxID=2081491 RepID=A0A8J6CED6_DIALT|nr:hypothetical protein KFE25_008184 [Diacronema lutheri]
MQAGGAQDSGEATLADLFAPSSPALSFMPPADLPHISQRASLELHLVCISLLFISCVCFGCVLVFLEPVLKPLVFAIFLSYLLSPAVDLLTTPWSPRALVLRLTGSVPSHKPIGTHDDEEDVELVLGSPVGIGTPISSQRARAGSRARGAPSILPGTVALPHSVAVVAVLALTGCWIIVFVNLVVNSAASLEEKFPKYKAHAIELVAFARSAFGQNTALSKALKSVHHSLGGSVEISAVPAAWLSRWISELPITSTLMAFASTTLAALETTAIVLLYSVFLMMGGAASHAPHQRTARALGGTPAAGAPSAPDDERGALSLGEKIDAQVRRYIVLKSALSLLVAASVGTTLTLLSVDLAFLFGTVSFFANFVPNVGAVVATLLPLPVALLDPGLNWMSCSLAMIIPFGIHVLVGSVLEPKLFGMGLALHPVVVLFTVLLWALIWGVGGMIVAVPLTAVLRIALLEVQHPWAARCVGILEGRWMPRAPGAAARRARSRSASHSQPGAD